MEFYNFLMTKANEDGIKKLYYCNNNNNIVF